MEGKGRVEVEGEGGGGRGGKGGWRNVPQGANPNIMAHKQYNWTHGTARLIAQCMVRIWAMCVERVKEEGR